MVENRKHSPSQGDNACIAEGATCSVGRGEQDEARSAISAPRGGLHHKRGRFWIKTWSSYDFSIAETTWRTLSSVYSYPYLARGICKEVLPIRCPQAVRSRRYIQYQVFVCCTAIHQNKAKTLAQTSTRKRAVFSARCRKARKANDVERIPGTAYSVPVHVVIYV